MGHMSDNIDVRGWYLENRNGSHQKFYTVLIASNGYVVTAWGRIGAQGQSKIQKLAPSDATDVGLRQVFSKKTGGYTALTDDLLFAVASEVLTQAGANQQTAPLTRLFAEARTKPAFQGEKDAALKHYDDFTEKAQALLANASGRSFDEVWGEFEELQAAWQALDDKHSETRVTVDLCRAQLGQALMSGNLSSVGEDIF